MKTIFRPDVPFTFGAVWRASEDGELTGGNWRGVVGAVVSEGDLSIRDREELQKAVDYVVGRLEGRNLNIAMEAAVITPEWVASWLYRKLSISAGQLSHVRVESPRLGGCTYSEVSGDGRSR